MKWRKILRYLQNEDYMKYVGSKEEPHKGDMQNLIGQWRRG